MVLLGPARLSVSASAPIETKLCGGVRWPCRIVSRCMRSARPPRKGLWRDNARRPAFSNPHRTNMCLTRSSCGKQHMFPAHPVSLWPKTAYRLRPRLRPCQAVVFGLFLGVLPVWLRKLLLRYSATCSSGLGRVNSLLRVVLFGVLPQATRSARLLAGVSSISLLHKELLEVHQAQQLVNTSI